MSVDMGQLWQCQLELFHGSEVPCTPLCISLSLPVLEPPLAPSLRSFGFPGCPGVQPSSTLPFQAGFSESMSTRACWLAALLVVALLVTQGSAFCPRQPLGTVTPLCACGHPGSACRHVACPLASEGVCSRSTGCSAVSLEPSVLTAVPWPTPAWDRRWGSHLGQMLWEILLDTATHLIPQGPSGDSIVLMRNRKSEKLS